MRKLLYTIKSWLGNARFYFIVAFLFLIFAVLCFTWRMWSSLSIQLPIDPEIWGQFGDFVGGTLGVIFSLISVMLVVWTFKTQNETAETQRFNDLFFELPSGDSAYSYSKVTKSGSGTAVTLVFTVDAPSNTNCKLRIIK